jgi:hypothetical protein
MSFLYCTVDDLWLEHKLKYYTVDHSLFKKQRRILYCSIQFIIHCSRGSLVYYGI